MIPPRLAFVPLCLCAFSLCSCGTTKPNVDLTITDNGKGTTRITGTAPAPQGNPLTFIISLGTEAAQKLLLPWL